MGAAAGPLSFRPAGQGDLAPAGERAKLQANLQALRLLTALREQDRPAGPDEQGVLARWSGWGSLASVFDPARAEHDEVRRQLAELLGPAGYRAASRTTLNAHYTDAALVQVVWDALDTAGFAGTGGRVLEPGCGAGVFLGLAPASATELIGVELDPTTAAIAQVLYPGADIRAESFADTRLPAGSVDLTVGNVPFGKISLHDPVYNAGGHSLHNHFILKALQLTRSGGVVAVLTSHWTLDATNPAARREMAALAELVVAVRLPSTAHEKAAGTRVLTDLLVLRRHDQPVDPDDAGSPQPGGGLAWERAVPVEASDAAPVTAAADVPGRSARSGPAVNEVFAAHPDWVIGTPEVRLAQFGPALDVRFDGDVAGALHDRLQQALTAASRPGWTLFTPQASDATGPSRVLRQDAPSEQAEGHLAATDSAFTIVVDRRLRPHEVPATQARELSALLGLRDTTLALLTAEAASGQDTPELDSLRSQLNGEYDTYAARYGPINRVTVRRTGRVDTDPTSGAQTERTARIRPPQGGFRADPHAPAVYALEHYDATTGTASKATIMRGRVIAPRAPRLGADTPADAVAICLDTHGEVRLAEVARLLGQDSPRARAALTGLVFDPQRPGHLVPAPEYLSGNVRAKLQAAEQAAEQADRRLQDAAGGVPGAPAHTEPDDGGVAEPDWHANAAALRTVLPADLTPAEIDVWLGASWIGAAVVEQFLRETLADPTVAVENPGGSVWAVKGVRHSVLASSTYGTARLPAVDLAQAVLEQRQIRITDELEDGRRVLNLTETVAAQDKAAVLGEAFAEWLWADPQRAERRARVYNDTFNAIVLRSYDGSNAMLPGLAVTFTPREHQRAAVARMVSEPSVLLAHDVGAGKTASMIIGAIELRRLQMASKPAVVVPNHRLEQFTREWLQLYPQAQVLAAGTEDLAGARRRLLVARVATGDWDAVILSRSAFERLPLAPATQQAYLDSQLEQMRSQLENSRRAGGLTVKRLEGALARAEERLDALTDSARDPGVTFEQTGIDYLIVDEAHGYKNLRTPSNIVGVAIDGSQRASDLDMKVSYLRERHGARVATFATATPIANSVSEAYVMQRYLRPDVLDAAGLTDFDTWAATFGEVTTNLELSPDGSNYRMQSRFAKFRNVPELLRMWHLSADIKTAEDLQLPTPALTGGAASTAVVAPSPELTAMMSELSERADRVQSRQVDPAEDNMLRVATHGRMAALDLRLLGCPAGDPTKLVDAADRIAGIHARTAGNRYPGSDRPGALQVVFSDLGTPRDGWNVYDELRGLLTDRGVPAAQIAFVHTARNDRQKGELFAACRTGEVAVLLGSTERMGVGTNVQARAVALHHLDCPWRPADLAQREGRILRQGNLNDTVEIHRYVSEGSFDAYLWQTVERKARFIGQVMRGTLDVREIEDIGETALSYSEVKALATGDPRILDKARADADAARLERLERAHSRTRHSLHGTIERAEQRLPTLHREVALLEHAATAVVDTRGEHFAMTVGGQRLLGRTDAAAALRDTLLTLPLASSTAAGAATPVAQLAGLTVLATALRYPEAHLRLELADVPRSATKVELTELATHKPVGLVSRLENRAANLPATRADVEAEIDRLRTERDRATEQLTRPFPHAAALADARTRSAALAVELTNPPARTDAPSPSHAPNLGVDVAVEAPNPGVDVAVDAPNPGVDVAVDAATPAGPAGPRWQAACTTVDPRVVDDPHWPALSAVLDRAESTGLDVAATLTDLTRGHPLPEQHPARDLHYRLIGACPAAVTPTPPPTASTASPEPGTTPPPTPTTAPSRSPQLAAGERPQPSGRPR